MGEAPRALSAEPLTEEARQDARRKAVDDLYAVFAPDVVLEAEVEAILARIVALDAARAAITPEAGSTIVCAGCGRTIPVSMTLHLRLDGDPCQVGVETYERSAALRVTSVEGEAGPSAIDWRERYLNAVQQWALLCDLAGAEGDDAPHEVINAILADPDGVRARWAALSPKDSSRG